ncbi:hypothetical protein MKW94_019199 [Papaver nudicaule]|uniref:Uncharacterized protein n=1 Tax=Papaver nudicaule TaxID=74823 RepID=A0AA41RNB4_PAPNU|nr:hypothetical protein [Papaver nudicaule]MCL7047486.1 hypothetical protein [Papaver nudicaule]
MEEANYCSEASCHNASSSTSMSTTINLANPLVDQSSVVPQRPTGTTRKFDNYMDPMAAAFSEHRRPNNFYPIPPPSHQRPRRTFESTPPDSWISPITPPFRGPPPGAWNGPGGGLYGFPYNSNFGGYRGTGPGHGGSTSWRSPVAPPFHGNRGPPPGAWNRPGPPPGAWHRPGGAGGHGFPSNSSFGGYRGTGSRRGVSNPGPRPSRTPYQRRGSNYTLNNRSNPGSRQGGGGGRNVWMSAKERPEMFYNKSMVEDPWKNH